MGGGRPVTRNNEIVVVVIIIIIIISLTEQSNKLNTGHEEHKTKTKYHTCFVYVDR
jgi:hypothetical protein